MVESVAVILPTYFDGEPATEIISAIRSLNPEDCSIHFFLIDEALGADSALESVRNRNDVTIVTQQYQMGPQSAIVATLRSLNSQSQKFDWYLVMDADGEDRPGDVIRLLNQRHDSDIVLAKRGKRHSKLSFAALRTTFNLMFRFLTGTKLETGTFSLVSSKWAAANIGRPEFSLSYTGSLLALPAKRTFVTCDRGRRTHGVARLKPLDSISEGLRLLLPFSRKISARMFLFTVLSAVLALPILIWVLILKFLNAASPGWVTSAITLLGGAMGLLALATVLSLILMALVLLGTPNSSDQQAS